jgi:hypothetical protein
MVKKLTAAEVEAKERRLVHHKARERARNKVVIAAIAALRPELEMAFISGEAPLWFESIIWKCKIDAMGEAVQVTPQLLPDWKDGASDADYLAYNEAHLPAFAEAFSTLLARALVKHDAESGT